MRNGGWACSWTCAWHRVWRTPGCCLGIVATSSNVRLAFGLKWCIAQIVVATNVAETSITIDDVTCVIDAGRVKELGYDAERGIARLQVSASAI